MNKKMFILFFAWISFLVCRADVNPVTVDENDTLLCNIQSKVLDAFTASFRDDSPDKLLELETLLKEHPVQNRLTDYWGAYAKYYSAIYHLQTNDRKACSKAVNDAIGLLEKVTDKDSETYALLAYIQSFSLQFADGMEAAAVSSKIRQHVETAIRLDSANVRAWFVMALSDYYTPVAFGGGTKCEEYLLKAISLDEQSIANPYLPDWGKSETYAMLIGYYAGKKDYSTAKEYLKKAQALFPDDYMISRYAESLHDK